MSAVLRRVGDVFPAKRAALGNCKGHGRHLPCPLAMSGTPGTTDPPGNDSQIQHRFFKKCHFLSFGHVIGPGGGACGGVPGGGGGGVWYLGAGHRHTWSVHGGGTGHGYVYGTGHGYWSGYWPGYWTRYCTGLGRCPQGWFQAWVPGRQRTTVPHVSARRRRRALCRSPQQDSWALAATLADTGDPFLPDMRIMFAAGLSLVSFSCK